MGLKKNFIDILLGGGNQTIDTWNIAAAREANQTQDGIREATGQWNKTLAENKQGYENYNAFANFIKTHPDQFTGNWDRRLSALYQDQPGLFKGESFDANIIGLDELTDIALIKINGFDLKVPNFGNSDERLS